MTRPIPPLFIEKAQCFQSSCLTYDAVCCCHKLPSLEPPTYDGLLSQPRGPVSRPAPGFAARARPPDGTSQRACQSQADGRFSTLQAQRAGQNVAALFASSLNGDTRFRIVARSSGMRFALYGDSQINFARRIVCNPANENGDGDCEWPSPFEHRNERMNSMVFETLLAAIGSAGYITTQVRWALGAGDERHGMGQRCEPGAG
jgi:hypothetical protein